MTVIADESPLSPQLIAVRDAIGPVVRRFRARTDAVPRQADPVHDMFDFISHHLQALEDWATDIADEIGEGLGRVASDPDATDEEVRFAVYGLERSLRRLLRGFDNVRSVNPNRTQKRGWDLLMRVYQHLVDQVQGWLDELVECLDDPLAAAEKRGVADRETLELPVTLALDPPAETMALVRWAQDHGARSAQTAERTARWRARLVGLLVVVCLVWLFGITNA